MLCVCVCVRQLLLFVQNRMTQAVRLSDSVQASSRFYLMKVELYTAAFAEYIYTPPSPNIYSLSDSVQASSMFYLMKVRDTHTRTRAHTQAQPRRHERTRARAHTHTCQLFVLSACLTD